jgi:hypothetical protein
LTFRAGGDSAMIACLVLAPPGPWNKRVHELDIEAHKDTLDRQPLTQETSLQHPDTKTAARRHDDKEQLEWHHFISCNGRLYKPSMTGRELQNVTCNSSRSNNQGSMSVGDYTQTQFRSQTYSRCTTTEYRYPRLRSN